MVVGLVEDFQTESYQFDSEDNLGSEKKSVYDGLESVVEDSYSRDFPELPTLYEYSRRIQRGDSDAYFGLLKDYSGFINQIANCQHKLLDAKYPKVSFNHQDVVYVVSSALIRTAEDFEQDRGLKFKTYLWHWVRGKISGMLRTNYGLFKRKNKRKICDGSLRRPYSLSSKNCNVKNKLIYMAKDKSESNPTLNKMMQEKFESTKKKMTNLFELYSSFYLDLVHSRYCLEDTYNSISETHGLSSCRAEQIIKRINPIMNARISGLFSEDSYPFFIRAFREWYQDGNSGFNAPSFEGSSFQKLHLNCLSFLAEINDKSPIDCVNYLTLPLIKQAALEIHNGLFNFGVKRSQKLHRLVDEMYSKSVYLDISKGPMNLEEVKTEVLGVFNRLPLIQQELAYLSYGLGLNYLGISKVKAFIDPSHTSSAFKKFDPLLNQRLSRAYILSDPDCFSCAVREVYESKKAA